MSQSVSVAPKRYHPALVALHWLTPIIVFIPLFVEGEGKAGMKSHMTFGLIALALMVVRLFVRFSAKRPEWASTGNKYLDMFGEWVHYGLYFLIIALALSGIFAAVQLDQIGLLFGEAAGKNIAPKDMRMLSGFLHGIPRLLFILFFLMHVMGAFYHQIFVRDGLMGRMWFGKQ